MTTSYYAVPFRREAHGEALATLWRDNFSDARLGAIAAERMTWLYERNPDGVAQTMLALVRGSDEVVGCGSTVLRRMDVGGREVTAGLLADFAVARGHRTAGAALAIQRALARGRAAEGVQLRYGYPNEKSLAVFKRLGYRILAQSTRWVKPLAITRGFPVPGGRLGSRAAKHVVDTGLVALDEVLSFVRRSHDRARGKGDLRVFEVARADARFDELWCRARRPHRVAGARSADYLNWRYGALRGEEHGFVCLGQRPDGPLLGYGIYRVRSDGGATLEDLLCDDPDAHAAPLLLGIARHLRRRGVPSLACSYVGPERFATQLRRAGFIRRQGARAMVVHVDANAPAGLASAVLDKDAWLVMDGELDL